jgi:hypothetical protein
VARRTTTTPGIVSTALLLLGQASWRMLRRRLPTWPAFLHAWRRGCRNVTGNATRTFWGRASELLKLLVYGYIRKPGSATVVIIDPHGDLAEEIARFKEHRKSDRLIYIDPYLDGISGRMPTINPFDLRDTGPQVIDIAAQSMVEAFKQILGNTALALQMEALLIPCVSVLLKCRAARCSTCNAS